MNLGFVGDLAGIALSALALGTGVVLVIGLVVTALVWVTGSSAARRARLAHQPIEPGSQRGDRAHVAPASTRAAAG